MGRFLRWLLGLSLIWCLWWGGASFALRSGAEAWLADRRAEGWQAEASEISGGGFPAHLQARLEDAAFADPQTGVAVGLDWLLIEADAWWPGRARIALPDTPIRLAAPDGRADVTMADGLMRLDLAPGTALALENLSWTAGPWAVAQADGTLIEAQDLVLRMSDTDTPNAYAFDISAAQIAPGQALRDAWQIPQDWPLAFDRLQLDMDVTFDRPWDRHAIEDQRPQPRRIDLHLAEAAWGPLRLNLASTLDIDAQGLPNGSLSLQAENWRQMLDLAVAAGAFPSAFRDQADNALTALANASGNVDTIDVTLTARNGTWFLGFIPLGPTPRIVLR